MLYISYADDVSTDNETPMSEKSRKAEITEEFAEKHKPKENNTDETFEISPIGENYLALVLTFYRVLRGHIWESLMTTIIRVNFLCMWYSADSSYKPLDNIGYVKPLSIKQKYFN